MREIPGEDRDAGLYVNESTEGRPRGTEVLRLETSSGEQQVWVSALDFMRVQKERDDLRRTLALLNVVVRRRDYVPARSAFRLLDEAGLTAADADAMAELVHQILQADLT